MRRFLFILFLMGCLLLAGCGDTASDGENQNDQTMTGQDDNTQEEDKITTADVLAVFEAEEKNKDCVVTDCVVTPDGAYGLIGVVQYTDADGNDCCLAFVKEDYSHPLGLDAENKLNVAEDSVLTYVGDGVVTLTLVQVGVTLEQDGVISVLQEEAIYDYTVKYSFDEAAGKTDFVVSSEERK